MTLTDYVQRVSGPWRGGRWVIVFGPGFRFQPTAYTFNEWEASLAKRAWETNQQVTVVARDTHFGQQLVSIALAERKERTA